MDKVVIIGAGISGLSLAYYILDKKPDIDITILESEQRPGGKVWTERADGFICEAGVNGFLDNKRGVIELAERIRLEPLRSRDSARKRYIYINGKLRLIPDTPQGIFLSNFLSFKARLRLIGEYFVPKRNLEDETIESFVTRRVGREFFEKLLDPMVTGIYAGDPSKLSIRSCFPKVYELERQYGGLIKGFISLRKATKGTGKKLEAGPGGVLHSFKTGMFDIVERLRDYLGNRLKTSSPVESIDRQKDLYLIYCKNGTVYEATKIIIATPAYEASRLLKDFDRRISLLLEGIPYPPISVVALGFRKNAIKTDTDYFGFLIPGREKRRILGCLFDSSIFLARAPEDHVLLRCMIGGARAPELAILQDAELLKVVLEELDSIIGIKDEPVFKRIFRYEKAIPQYVLGHDSRLQEIEGLISKYKGLYLTGNAYRGVAMNDCISNSTALAKRLIQELQD